MAGDLPAYLANLLLPWSYLRAIWQRSFGTNLSQVEPLLFVGGAFSAGQWPLIARRGVRAVLNLQAEREDSFEGLPPERTLRLPVPDHEAPSLHQLDAAVGFIASAIAADLPVLVHCHAGVGRAPTTAAAYVMACYGLDSSTAIAYLRRSRPMIAPNQAQCNRLREWEQRLATQAPEHPVSQPARPPDESGAGSG